MYASSASTRTKEPRPNIIFIANETTVTAYVRATLQDSFAVMDDQEEITHNHRLYAATRDRDLIEQLIQSSHPTQRPYHPIVHNKKAVTPQPKWFTDDSGKQQYGTIVTQGEDCPLFLFEEQVYVHATRTLYTTEQQPTAEQATPNTSFVSNNRSFSSTSAWHSSLPPRNQKPSYGKQISPLTSLGTNDSFGTLPNLSSVGSTNSDIRSKQTSTTSPLVHFSIHSK